jgi:hypothetical protein
MAHRQHLCRATVAQLKHEEVYLHAYATVAEARTGIGVLSALAPGGGLSVVRVFETTGWVN